MGFKNEEEYVKALREKANNCVINIAKKHERTYITPEDVTEALESHDEDEVRKAVLEVMGTATGFGVEDKSLTAFVAFEGKTK